MKKALSKKKPPTGGRAAEAAFVARLLKWLRSGRDLRKGKVRRVKSSLRHGTYINALKFDVAADRLAGELADDT